MGRLTVLNIHSNSKGTGIFVIPDGIQGIPKPIWAYSLCESLKSASPSTYKSAVLTKSYMGGMRDGKPFKQSSVFLFFEDLPPSHQSKPVATITFTMDLRDNSIRFVANAMELGA